MPEILDDVATQILHCYRSNARYRDAEVERVPWEQADDARVERSALIAIRYQSASANDVYEMNVGLLARRDELRVAMVSDTGPVPSDASCALARWTKPKP
jgi:hypothetical protein